MSSAVLSTFWGQRVQMDGYILLPPSYYREPQKTYPVLYWIEGFDGNGAVDSDDNRGFEGAISALHSEFVIVSLDGMFNGGHQVFADSPNNGPWGEALTTEFIPLTEKEFRGDGTRFVAGHSSGGWSAMWLQITYPDLFAGEWSLSPDPLDFRDFMGPDITQTPPQNFFTDRHGKDYDLDGQPLRSFVRDPWWGKRQYDSFESVFSPAGPNDKPLQLFDRKTGLINPAVQSYWNEHWNIAALVQRQWPALGPKLAHKLHVIVGTGDTFGLDRPVRLFQKDLDALPNSDAEFDYVPGADHWGVFKWKGNAFAYILGEAKALLTAPAH
ncbi:MAG TPA: alpha/beta hydrolase [Candidatus Baltobacteraceae bacterium]|nr:alpha/beta hydrolase [Candidatus Baltobacteraceae bacterium]